MERVLIRTSSSHPDLLDWWLQAIVGKVPWLPTAVALVTMGSSVGLSHSIKVHGLRVAGWA